MHNFSTLIGICVRERTTSTSIGWTDCADSSSMENVACVPPILSMGLAKKYPGISDPIRQMNEQLKSNANKMANDPETTKRDLIHYGTAVFSFVILAFALQSSWLHKNVNLVMIGIFVLGYIGIIFEEFFEFNKGAVALLMSTGLWLTYADFFNNPMGIATSSVVEQLYDQLAEVPDICFFLLAAGSHRRTSGIQGGNEPDCNHLQEATLLDHWLCYLVSFCYSQ